MDSISQPVRSIDKEGNMRVKHREYVGDVFSVLPEFGIQKTITLNPTDRHSFPWLSSIAGSFQKFCFEKLGVEYVTQSGTSTPGSVMLIPQYDYSDPIPTSKQEALAFVDTVRTPAWQEARTVLPHKRLCMMKEYFTRIDLEDIKMSVPGKVSVATSGCSDAGPTVGEIWINYEVKLSSPQQSNSSATFFQRGDTFEGETTIIPGDFYQSMPGVTLTNTSDGFSINYSKPGTYLVSISYQLHHTNSAHLTQDMQPLPNGLEPRFEGVESAYWNYNGTDYTSGQHTASVEVFDDPVSIHQKWVEDLFATPVGVDDVSELTVIITPTPEYYTSVN